MEGANVLDAFAGTGSMGLESLSRGALRVVFVEHDRGAILNLRNNVAALGVERRSVVLPIDAYRAIRHTELPGDWAAPFDVAFIDPPYAHSEPGREHARLKRLLAELATGLIAPDGLISLRHPSQVSIAPLVPQGCVLSRELTYGSMRISWLARENTD
jgi:16S rRNA (guanine966-N2)-methyltransferase